MNLDIQCREENKLVADWLLHYPERKAVYESLKEAFAYPLAATEDRLPVQTNRTTDSTARIGIGLAEGKIVPERDLDPKEVHWLEVVEYVQDRLPQKARILLKLRREVAGKTGSIKRGKYRGRPAWIPFVQRRYAEEEAKRLKVAEEKVWIDSPSYFSRQWRYVVDLTARVASKRGLLQ